MFNQPTLFGVHKQQNEVETWFIIQPPAPLLRLCFFFKAHFRFPSTLVNPFRAFYYAWMCGKRERRKNAIIIQTTNGVELFIVWFNSNISLFFSVHSLVITQKQFSLSMYWYIFPTLSNNQRTLLHLKFLTKQILLQLCEYDGQQNIICTAVIESCWFITFY